MKTWMVLFAILLVPAQASAQVRSKIRYTDGYDKSWAVVIGIDAYRNVPRLNYAAADAQAIAALLPALGFPRENTFLLLNDDATLSKIKEAFYVKLRQMGRNDRLVVYFAGHGETEQIRDGEEGYILPVDASPDNLAGTAIAMDEIQRITQRLRAKHYLFLLDACFSGFAVTRSALSKGVPDDYYANARREPVTQVITAGRKGEVVIERGGHGIFTKRLLDGLRGLADTEGRGLISATQLFAWIEPRVIVDSDKRMTPQYSKFDGEGQFIFDLRTGGHRPAATDLTGTFTGMVESVVNNRKYQMPVTVTFVQRAKSLSGTWTSSEGASGSITGIVDGSNIQAFKVTQSNPCAATLAGTASAQGGQNVLVGSYSGLNCNGRDFINASFRITRIDREQRLDDSPLEASDLVNIGMSYFRQQRYDDAIDYLQQARDLAESKHDDKVQMTALALLGSVRNAQGLEGDAIRALRRAQSLAEQLESKIDQAIIANMIGLVHMSRKQYGEAQKEFERGLFLAQQVGSDAQQSYELFNLGVVALEQQRHSEALALFDRAMEKAAGLSEPERENIRKKQDEARRQIQR